MTSEIAVSESARYSRKDLPSNGEDVTSNGCKNICRELQNKPPTNVHVPMFHFRDVMLALTSKALLYAS
jgi:hypothetical protein